MTFSGNRAPKSISLPPPMSLVFPLPAGLSPAMDEEASAFISVPHFVRSGMLRVRVSTTSSAALLALHRTLRRSMSPSIRPECPFDRPKRGLHERLGRCSCGEICLLLRRECIPSFQLGPASCKVYTSLRFPSSWFVLVNHFLNSLHRFVRSGVAHRLFL